MVKRPTAIDLFAGCGGMSLGLEAAGFDIVASVEYDPIHAIVHHFNFPYSAMLCTDIKCVSKDSLFNLIAQQGFSTEIDLIAGGPPCQGFSHIGKRQLDDPRNSLVFEYVRLIKEIRPKYFVFENVPGIGTGKHKQFLQELIAEFENVGYHVTKPVQILDASSFGVPQKRKRLIMLGSRHDMDQLTYPPKSHSEKPNSSQIPLFNNPLNPLVTVSDAIGDLTKQDVNIGEDLGINAALLDYSGFRSNFSLRPDGQFALCHNRSTEKVVRGHLGSKHTEKSIKRFSETKPGSSEKISRFFKLSAEGQCNTLRAGTASNKGAFTAPRPIHYEKARCITIREAARLHSFPDWFQFHRTIWHGFREIGNAVTPLLAKVIGDHIVKDLGINSNELETRMLEKIDENLLSYTMGQAANYWGVSPNVIPKRQRVKKMRIYEQV